MSIESNPPRVLVVEDNRTMRDLLVGALCGSCRVTTVAGGAEAIRLALADPPDLILSDVILTEFSGDRLVEALRGQPALDGVPILFLTAMADEALRVKMLRMGVGDFLFKPFSTDELLARVGALLEGRRRAREAQLLLETRFQATFEQALVGMAHLALDGRCLRMNQRFCDILGYSMAELLGRRLQDLAFTDDLELDLYQRDGLLQGQAPSIAKEKQYVKKDGSSTWVNRTVSFLGDLAGRPESYILVVEDINARKQAEQALVRHEAALGHAQRLAGLGKWKWDLASGLHTWSQEVYRIYGRDPGLPPMDLAEADTFYTPASRARLGQAVDAALTRGVPYECDAEVVRPDGTRRWVVARGEAERAPDGAVRCLRGTIQDITERKLLEETLRVNAAMMDCVSEGVCLVRVRDRVILRSNRGMDALFGYPPGEMVGLDAARLDAPGCRTPAEERAMLRILDRDGTWNGELQSLRKDGSPFWTLVTTATFQHAELGAVWVMARHDITSRREAEQAILRVQASLEVRVVARTAELQRANSELESFSYAVSHDLRAPLRAMSCFSQALVEDLGPRLQAGERTCLDQIMLASARMADLIDGILQLSRTSREDLRREWVELSPMAERIRLELERSEPGRTASWDIGEGLRAWGDPRLLEATLRNLLDNAWKYSSGQGRTRIAIRGEVVDGVTRITVTDHGAGFDMAHAAKLFQPFQRLHRQDEFPGLGIGLATSQRIIHRHGGTIEAHSQPGLGAAFTLILPGPGASENPS
jgi:PAS domain S-box-containing protein